jgi:murein L,D-transpeptidase YafK
MRQFLLLLLLSQLLISQNSLLDSYRSGGIENLQREVEKLLQSKLYWLSRLKDYDTDFGYYEDLKFLLLANKGFQTLDVYSFDDSKNRFELIEILNSFVGEKKGQKEREGDKRTPSGVYHLTEKLLKVDQFYGPLAFVTSYPNLYDRLLGRTGSGIWIHGVPIAGGRKEFTRGCIAISNDKLVELEKSIELEKTLLITSDRKLPKTSKGDLATILSSLYGWLSAWRDSDLEKYLKYYNRDEFKRHDGKRFEWFREYKRRIFKRKKRTTIRFSKINIAPYPNIYKKNLFYISFHEYYRTPTYKFDGQKVLFVEIEGGEMRILIEK